MLKFVTHNLDQTKYLLENMILYLGSHDSMSFSLLSHFFINFYKQYTNKLVKMSIHSQYMHFKPSHIIKNHKILKTSIDYHKHTLYYIELGLQKQVALEHNPCWRVNTIYRLWLLISRVTNFYVMLYDYLLKNVASCSNNESQI